ncbi:MAG TPA: metal ABC transporter permease [Acidimicrobiales bacterium]|nr:metal ABC transporter permease [Acidimicrobiales bacterium]
MPGGPLVARVLGGALRPLVEPGFLSSGPVRTALVVGTVVAAVSAAVGVVTVVRGQGFAGHALADIGSAGGAAAVLVGAPTVWGFVAFNVAAAGVIDLVGVDRRRGRDVATGIVLGVALGLAALFLYEDAVSTTATGTAVVILFGSLFAVPTTTVPLVAALGAASALALAALWRPLLLTSVNPDLAAARGVPVRAVGGAFLAILAVAVSLSAVTIGAILSTALLIGPAATALRCTARPARAVALAAVTGVAATWVGVLVAYDSADWLGGRGLPVSFCVVAAVVAAYAVSSVAPAARRRRPPAPPGGG